MSQKRSTMTLITATPGNIENADLWDTGRIKWFDERRRFGFITPDEGDSDIFFPWTVLKACGIAERDAQEGIRVRFKWTAPDRAGRRPSATHIAIIKMVR